MTIELSSYNLEEAQIDVANLLFKNHPNKKREWYCKEMGCSTRTLARWIQSGKIVAPIRTKGIDNAIELLNRAGYRVIRDEASN